MIRFLPCPHCRRHVNSVETACPFCATSMASAQPRAALALPVGRLGRIAVLAAGASVVAAAAASCADSPNKTDAGSGGQGGNAGTAGQGGSAGRTTIDASAPTDAQQEFDGQIAIYSAAIALPKNKT